VAISVYADDTNISVRSDSIDIAVDKLNYAIAQHRFPKFCTRNVAYLNYMPIKTIVNVFYNKATSQI
jgi:hypothetical protein